MHRFILPFGAALIALPLSATAETGSFDNAGVTIHYADEGEGPAVVLLHSFAGSSAMWPAVGLAPLDGFRTITFDARGHGASDKPTDADAYGARMVDDLRALMDARDVEQAHVVGYSMGAEIALKFAVDHPSRVLSLVVAGSGWSGEAEAGTYGFVADALAASASFGDFMAAMAPEGDVSEEDQIAGLALLAAHGIAPDQPAAPLAAVAASLPSIIGLSADALAGITVPVLGIAGETDPERDNGAALAGALPAFRYVEIAGADHLAAPRAPDFADIVSGFLTR